MIRASIIETEKPKRPKLYIAIAHDRRDGWQCGYPSTDVVDTEDSLHSGWSEPQFTVTIPGEDDALTEANVREAAELFLSDNYDNYGDRELEMILDFVKSLGVLEDGG